MIRKLMATSLGVVAFALLLCVAGYLWLRTSLPNTDGTMSLNGLNSPVEVFRDKHSVPHIFAENDHDAYFALGYVHAQDRLWQMELSRRAGRGTLAELLGKKALAADTRLRALGFHRVAERIFENSPKEVKEALEAYTAGVNAWLENRTGALPPEFYVMALLDIAGGNLPRVEVNPWLPTDSLMAGRLMAMTLGRNRRGEILRARISRELSRTDLEPALLKEFFPRTPAVGPITVPDVSNMEPRVLDRLWSAAKLGTPQDGGSNGWILNGGRTDTGQPIFANDPHLGYSIPILWYFARIEAPDLSVTGVTLPGVPFMIFGHNNSIAWGVTNAGGDVQDHFIETIDPSDARRYLAPDGSLRFIEHNETFRVRGDDDFQLVIRETRHGPVISDALEFDAADLFGDNQVVAFASPAFYGDDRSAEAIYRLNRARNWRQFQAAAEIFHTPHVNLFFAGQDGDIGLISAGRIPIRNAGDGTVPVPGHKGTYDWTGFIPASELPRIWNPGVGYVSNANNRIVGDKYPYLITRDWALPFRAERIAEILDSKTRHTLEDNKELQLDILSPAARLLVPMLLEVEVRTTRMQAAADLLADWDFKMSRSRPEPLIYAAWLRNLIAVLSADEVGADIAEDATNLVFSPGPYFVESALTRNQHWCDDIKTPETESCDHALAASLELALDQLSVSLGSDMLSWQWGALHQATLPHRTLTNIPFLGKLSDRHIAADGGDHTLNRGKLPRVASDNPYANTSGAGFRALYDLSNLENSELIIATGQSGNFLSPHYDDFLQPWRDGEYIKVSGNRDAVASTAIGVLRLQP